MDRWFRALDREASRYSSLFSSFDTVYVGGGTPSFLPAELLEALMSGVVSRFPVADGAEITIEANPCDIDPKKIGLFEHLGFNRVSLGVQALDADALAFLGRFHTVVSAERALWDLQSLWHGSLAVDLIYGIPGQSENRWFSGLKRILSFEPGHISCYQLSVENGTPLHRRKCRGAFQMPAEDSVCSLFIGTSRLLASQGYTHYEVSNFATDLSGGSRHNGKYWRHAPYLGLGPSAHSFDGARRWWNVSSIDRYSLALETGELPVEGREVLGDAELRREALFLGLRTSDGIPLSLVPDTAEKRAFIDRSIRMGLLDIAGGKIRPTTKGLLAADYLAVSLC